MMTKPILALLVIFASVLAPGCGLNRSEYDRMRDIKNEYLAQLAEIRQANETINRNILSAYQELGVLRARLDQLGG